MTSSRQANIRERATQIKQRAALKHGLQHMRLSAFTPDESMMICGEARNEWRRRIAGCTAEALRKDKVMPNGFTLTVCHGEHSLLPRLPGWFHTVQAEILYIFGFDRTPDVLKFTGTDDAAFMKVRGDDLARMLAHLLRDILDDPAQWPVELFWVGENLGSGVVFSEYAGTPQVPAGDDRRIFEISSW